VILCGDMNIYESVVENWRYAVGVGVIGASFVVGPAIVRWMFRPMTYRTSQESCPNDDYEPWENGRSGSLDVGADCRGRVTGD
jgi:hypothetical protein